MEGADAAKTENGDKSSLHPVISTTVVARAFLTPIVLGLGATIVMVVLNRTGVLVVNPAWTSRMDYWELGALVFGLIILLSIFIVTVRDARRVKGRG